MFLPGDVVVLDFPGAQGVKVRPGVVVSSVAYHSARPDLIVGLCTSQVSKAFSSMDYCLQDWQAAGLKVPTAYRSYFAMCESHNIIRRIGHLTDRDWHEVQARLKLAIAIS